MWSGKNLVEMGMQKKAVVLLSGGLDSTLAAHIMLEQGIEMEAVHFTGVFCNCPSGKSGCGTLAREIASEMKIPVRMVFKGMDYLDIVRTAPHGYGRGLNPCIDCRIYMLRKVRHLMPEMNASFIVTGEVLGQRPMSQHRDALRIIEQESGTTGLVLRPLSARHFPLTIPEIEGIVDREKLLAVSGRSRSAQIQLARKFGISEYPCPAGGCLLTDKAVAVRLLDLFSHTPNFTLTDARLTTFGRHFRVDDRIKIVVGRNKQENEKLEVLAEIGSTLFISEGFPGPTAIVSGCDPGEKYNPIIGGIIAFYGKSNGHGRIRKKVVGGAEQDVPLPKPLPVHILNGMRINQFVAQKSDANSDAMLSKGI